MTTPPGSGDTQKDKWHKFYAEGENPNGMRALTPNGCSSDRGAGLNHQYDMLGGHTDGSPWEMPRPDFPMGIGISGSKGKVGSGMRSNRNRTGE